MVQKLIDTSSLLREQMLERVAEARATDRVRPVTDRKKDREDEQEHRRDTFERGEDSNGHNGDFAAVLHRLAEGAEAEEDSGPQQLLLPGVQVSHASPEAANGRGGTLDLEA